MSQEEKVKTKPKLSPLSCIDDYEFHRSLGKGSMGKVKLGIHTTTGEKVNKNIYSCILSCNSNLSSTQGCCQDSEAS